MANPQLLQISAFSIFESAVRDASGAACKPCQMKNKISPLKDQFDISMTQLSEADKSKFKQILAVEQICFYSSTNRTKPVCF